MTGYGASTPLWTTATNQTQKPVLTFDTTLKYAEVLLSWSSVKMPGGGAVAVKEKEPQRS